MNIRQITCRTLPVKRSDGHSAVAGAAYRAGEKLRDDRLEKTTNYKARSPDVWLSEILAPDDTPDWVHDREALWNAAERAEKRKDGRPARDVTFGLPWGMSQTEHEEAARSYARKEFVDKGHVVDLCFHRYGSRVSDHSEAGRETLRRWASKNVPFLERVECEDFHEPHVKIERGANGQALGYKIFQPHAHAYITPRALEENGFSAKRNRTFDRAEQAKEWRYGWSHHVNERLEATGKDFRVSALAPETDEHLPLKPEDMPLQSYHIEQEGKESVLREERTFNGVHNSAIRDADAANRLDAVIEQEDTKTGRNSRYERIQAWFGNVRSHFGEWRDHLKDRAGSFVNRWRAEDNEPLEEATQHEQTEDPFMQHDEIGEEEHER